MLTSSRTFRAEIYGKPARSQHRRILIPRDKAEAIRFARVLIDAFQDVLDYDPNKHHNQGPPALWLSEPSYHQEIHKLVAELKRLTKRLERKTPSAKPPKEPIFRFAKHLDTFLDSYAGAFGKTAAALTIAAAGGLLYHLGLGKEIIDNIWSHLKLAK